MRTMLLAATVFLVIALPMYGCRDVHGPLGWDNSFRALRPSVTGSAQTSEYGQAVDLIAGRNTTVGSVRCWIKGDSLHVRYSTDGGWVLTATHLIVAESLEDIPLAAGKNPKVGQFPLKQGYEPPVSEYRYSLKLSEWGLDRLNTLVIAAHADVALLSEAGRIEREEGAWAEGTPFSPSAPDNPHGGRGSGFAKGGIEINNGSSDPQGGGNWAMYFMVDVYRITVSELKINEIFYAGSCASTFYFYDQFVELYNTSDDTLYLDGIILTRQSQITYDDQEQIDYVRAIYAYQFPGTPVTGRQHPIAPGEHIVIATDGVDHRQFCANSVDLSNADFECFNEFGNDYDNPLVPNIVNINPTRTVDYLLNLTHNAVVLATGAEYTLYEETSGGVLVLIPIRTILDAVEYSSSAAVRKQLTIRVDAGFAGIGNMKYSGQSTERREPGFDTDNSTFDFVLRPHPTPGY